MFDAYTVKKVLPRLVIAVIFIQLSWFIFTGMIALTTAVAYGVEGLIYAPFGSREDFSLAEILSSVTGGGNGIFLAIMVAGAGTLGLLGGALTLALGAVLSILLGFIMLLLRQVIIVALLLISPLAIVAWILPNTEKFWKLWWENFSKLLLVFPMIVGVVAVGRVFAYITAGVDPGGSAENLATDFGIDELVTVFFIIIGFFGPFFLIPKLFSLAGSAFASANNLVNNRAQGAFGFLKKSGQGKRAEKWHAFKGGDRFGRDNIAARGLNRVGKGIGLGWSGRFGVGQRGLAAADLSRRIHAADALKENKKLQQAQFDDPGIAVLALSGGNAQEGERISHVLAQEHGWDEAQRRRALGVAQNVGFNGSNATAAIDLMAQNKSRMLTGNLGGETGAAMVRESAAHIAHGNAQLRDNIAGSYAYHSRNAGRIDQGGEAGVSMRQGWERTTVQQHAASQTESLRSFGSHFVDRYHNGSDDEKRAAAISLMEMQNMLSGGATAANQQVINETLAAAGVDHNAGVAVEGQLAAGTGGVITDNDVRGLARVWDGAGSTPPAAGGGPVAPPPPAAPAS